MILGYITLLDLDSQLRIAEATLEGRAEYVRLFRRRLEGGAISGFEMSLVEADYETAAATIPELRRIIAQQEDGLSVLLGRNPGPIARASSLDGLVAPAVPASLPAELLTRRPDILQAEQQLVASNALIGAARALYFPRISITGLAGLASAALATCLRIRANSGRSSETFRAAVHRRRPRRDRRPRQRRNRRSQRLRADDPERIPRRRGFS